MVHIIDLHYSRPNENYRNSLKERGTGPDEPSLVLKQGTWILWETVTRITKMGLYSELY